MEVHALLANSEVSVIEFLGNRVEATVVVEIDERALAILRLIENRRFLELPSQISELVVMPYLLEAQFLALLLIPGEVEVQAAGILAAVALCLAYPAALQLRGVARL